VDLTPGQRLTLGRSNLAGLTIPSHNVSRNHAEIFWDGDAPMIRDLGSSNGTWVNGSQISRQPLEDGDELVIGPLRCTYRCVGPRGDFGQLRKRLATGRLRGKMTASALSGDLAETDMFDLLAMLELKQRSGSLTVKSPRGMCTVVLQNGAPRFAQAGVITGHDAIFDLLQWVEGQFRFAPTLEDPTPNVQVTITQILQEAKRRTAADPTA
jgi:hypothetical protein